MKKLLIATNVLTLILFYMSSFTGAKKIPAGTDNKNCDNIVMTYNTNTINGISIATAQTMASLYQDRITTYKSKSADMATYENSKAVWFSLERLKSFIWEIESTVCNKNCKNKKISDALGVRIYFGAYPDFRYYPSAAKKDYNVLPNAYANFNSVFMVPTFCDSKNGSNIDFDPRNMGADGCNPIPLNNFTGTGNSIKTFGGGGVKAFNTFNLPTPAGASLILTANETQFFKGENAEKKLDSISVNKSYLKRGGPVNLLFPSAVQSVMNHGNLYPPDNSPGLAF
jgi:hypothetical protein